MSPGQVLTLEVSKIVHGGWGIGRVDGQVVFVQSVLPDETVRVQVTDTKKSHAFAILLEVLAGSPDRVAHMWPEAEVSRPPEERVGGADYGHIALHRQRDLKAEVIEEALRRYGSFRDGFPGGVAVEPVGNADGLSWRTRVTLHVDGDGVAGQYGFHSHRVIPTATLPLAAPAIEALGAHRRRWPGATTVHLGVTSTGDTWAFSDCEDGADEIVTETVNGVEFSLTRSSFWQVHERAAETLFRAVGDAIDSARWDPEAANLDLYGGVGLFAVSLAKKGGPTTHVVSVEADKEASHHTTVNLSSWPNAEAVTADVKRFVHQKASTIRAGKPSPYEKSTVVLDPPRSGAGAEVIYALVAMSPAQIVYVACDPVAFARDEKMLAEAGYRVTSLRAFDLFPHTHHVEMVVGFSR